MRRQLTGAAVLALLTARGCVVLRQKGSHARVQCGECFTTVQLHAGETLPIGTLKKIERDLAPCLGKEWLP